jgi:hypothetical protein
MIIDESASDEEISKLTEAVVKVVPSMPEAILNTSFYPRIKVLQIPEIMRFCKEQTTLKNDLLDMCNYIGEYLSESDIHDLFDALKDKYNNENPLVGLEYHIESTRIDYGVVLFVVIKRDDVYLKKFIFRYRKSLDSSIDGLSTIGVPLNSKPLENVGDIEKALRASQIDALMSGVRKDDKK